MLLVYLALAFVFGIVLASLVPLPALIWAWWLLVPLGLLLIWRHDASLRRVHLGLLLFLLGALRLSLARPTLDENSLAAWNDKGTRTLIGVVVEPPDVRDYTTQVRLDVARVRVENDWRAVTGLALVNLPRESEARYGDRIQIYGEPSTPFESDDFSYKEYLARQNIHSVVRVYSGAKILERDQGNPFFAALYQVRDRAHATILAIFPEPAASLLAGILLGLDSGIPRDVRDAFSATNTAHIVAISGFNIAIVAGILTQFTGRLKRGGSLIVIAGLVAYTLFVGASASVVRAAVMGSLTVLARALKRPNDALNALAASALLMTAWNPFTLYDMGFQLSFLATLGLILYVTPLTRAFQNFLTRFTSHERAKQIVGALSDSLIVTIAAQITTTPLIVFAFHRFSLVGFLTNFLVLWAQPAVMIFGGIATLVGMIVQPVGQVLAWLALPFLEWTIRVVQATAALPVPVFEIGRVDVIALFACYAILFAVTFTDWRTVRTQVGVQPIVAMSILLVLGIWVWNFAATAPDGKTHVVFLDSGAATFIRTPSGAKILIDGGESPSATLAALGSRLPFWERTLDLIVLTNANDEHLAGLVAVLERYESARVIQVDLPTKPNDAQKKWSDLLAQKRVALISAREGTQVALDRDVSLNVNGLANNLAFARVRANGSTFLLADNATPNDQAALVREISEPSTVLVAPKKIVPEFFGAVSPQFAVLFVGRGARDKPAPELLATLAPATILRTDEHGAIEFIVDAQSVVVKTSK